MRVGNDIETITFMISCDGFVAIESQQPLSQRIQSAK
jgi:hypothetical protein